MAQSEPVTISLEFTPNPNTLKYSVNRTLIPDTFPLSGVQILNLAQGQERSLLGEKLIQIPGILSVMIGKTFVTISKAETGDWDQVHQGTLKAIEDHLNANLPVLHPTYQPSLAGGRNAGGADAEIVQKICALIDKEIKPAVAMDGGDIHFERFDSGVVYLSMHGSCAGCPSSTMTLKMGIETRLREAIPEVTEVVAV